MRLFIAIVLFVVAQQGFAADPPSKYALFVGVAKYKHAAMNHPELRFPEDDAKELAEIFKNAGYSVDLLLGKKASQEAVQEKLKGLKDKSDAGGVISLGFFGHGVDDESKNEIYFCPYDTEIRKVVDSQGRQRFNGDGQPLEEPDPKSLIKLADIFAALQTSPAGGRFLLMDCNRIDPSPIISLPPSLRMTDIPPNTAILFASSRRQKSFEHADWQHGAFAKCLMDELRNSGNKGQVSVRDLAYRVRESVEKLVSHRTEGRDRQTPQILFTNDFDLQMTK